MHRDLLFAAAILALAGALSFASSLEESLTADEPVQLTSGAAFLATRGDSRLSPEHPPLPRSWAALALHAVPHIPFSPDVRGFASGDATSAARDWLGDRNDGNRIVRAPRAAMLAFPLALAVTVGLAARRLFGREAGLLALTLTALEPSFLAHGHYVTNDVPITLFILLSILTFARWLERPDAGRLAVAAGAVAAASLTKMSWLLAVPALALMSALWALRSRRDGRRPGRSWLLASAGLATLLVTATLAIWAAFGFRFTPFRGDPPPSAPARHDEVRSGLSPVEMDEAWDEVLRDGNLRPERGLIPGALRAARRFRLLPESYLYGFAYARHQAGIRSTYFAGRFSLSGFRLFFPAALLLKTPLPTLLLFLGGLALLVSGRVTLPGGTLLPAGLFGFALLYAGVAIAGSLNIGFRHFFPVLPALLVVASAPAAAARSRTFRGIVLGAGLWLALVAVVSFPNFLGYFNELGGGWRNGHRWLVDSNLDWNQDLLRLRGYQRTHPAERIVLLSLTDPLIPRGLVVEDYVSRRSGQAWPPPPAAGTYVISVSWLVGTFNILTRDEPWEQPAVRERYAGLWARFRNQPPPEPDAASLEWKAYLTFDKIRRALLLRRLRSRPPDERIGTSLFLFRLTDGDLERLTHPD